MVERTGYLKNFVDSRDDNSKRKPNEKTVRRQMNYFPNVMGPLPKISLRLKQLKTSNENGKFIGEHGWGKGGAYTNVRCNSNQIEGLIYSEMPQYT